MALTEQVKEIAMAIGQYYLTKNSGDYNATEKEINDLKISKIEVVSTLHITTNRPGLLIGKQGKNTDALEKIALMPIKIIEDREDNINCYLIPTPTKDRDYDDHDWNEDEGYNDEQKYYNNL